MNEKIIRISKKDAINFLLPRHYSGRKPTISYAFGWMIDGVLSAVCTFGNPSARVLCEEICGKEYKKSVYELNRLCRLDVELPHQMSYFVSYCLRELKKENLIIVSYSDTAMDHNGYIYQACNFIYTGSTASKVDRTFGNIHPRTFSSKSNNLKYARVHRSVKHRYVYFCFDTKKKIKNMKKLLKYPSLPYPKGINKTYKLGTILEPNIIEGNIRSSYNLKDFANNT